jgi:hypothetical protein
VILSIEVGDRDYRSSLGRERARLTNYFNSEIPAVRLGGANQSRQLVPCGQGVPGSNMIMFQDNQIKRYSSIIIWY